MKKFIYLGVLISIIGIDIYIKHILSDKSSIEKKWKDAIENVKTYSELNSDLENKNRAFKVTIDQLKNSNDSIFKELDATRKKLNIKDSKVENLQYIYSTFTKVDTICLRDTIFKDTTLNVDTLLQDQWYSIKLGLKYPSSIVVEPMFTSTKNIVVSSKKETINPPKKFFLFRWFQKKHTVLNIDVIEKNPYIKEQTSRYIEIVR